MANDIDMEGMLDAGHMAPLDADAIPNENQAHFCMSCDEPLVNLYCGNCGQKNDDYRRSLWQLGKEAIASLTAVENRIWRTWAALLFKPGKVAREYADGRRMHWSSPVRVYIFMSILLFGFMEITNTYFFAMEVTANEVTVTNAEGEEEVRTRHKYQGHFFATEAQTREWNAKVDFDKLRQNFDDGTRTVSPSEFVDGWLDAYGGESPDWLDVFEVTTGLDASTLNLTTEQRRALLNELQRLETVFQQDLGDTPSPMEMAALDELEQTIEREQEWLATPPEPDELPVEDKADDDSDTVSFNVTGITGQTYNQNAIRELYLDYVRNPAIGNNILNKWLPRIVFLMMPLTMLIGAIFIRGRERRYRFGKRKGQLKKGHEALLYDHLVHAAYIHAVTYLLIFVGIVLTRFFVSSPAIPLGIVVILLLYLPISLKRMFGRGWFKTIWTAYGVGFIYLLIVLTLTTMAVAFGLEEILATRQAFSP